jgi:hypothetical protein
MLDKLPSPPTDNLYKFLTLIGLIVFVASWIVPEYVNYKTSEEETQITAELYRQVAAVSSVQGLTNEVLMHRVQQLKVAAETQFAQVHHRRNKVNWTGTLFSGLGILMFLIGVGHWYTHFQYHQNELIKLDVELRRQDLMVRKQESEKLRLELLAQTARTPENPISANSQA